MTNYEKIKAMSVEEMADFLGLFNTEEDICRLNNDEMAVDYCRFHNCRDCAMKYLKSEVEEND